MLTLRVIFACIVLLMVCGCRTPRSDPSDVLMYNAERLSPADPDFRRVAKLYYTRPHQGEFSSSAFFLTDKILITSGHTLLGDTDNFTLGKDEGPARTKLPIAGRLVSFNEYKRTVRGEVESMDLGILLLTDGSATTGLDPLAISPWPASLSKTIRILGTGQNPDDNRWDAVVKMAGEFTLFEVDPMILSYDMSEVGTAYTAVGDSGGPILIDNQVVGIHSSNYATAGAVSSGYGTSLFFRPLAEMLAGLDNAYLTVQLREHIARARYLACLDAKPELRTELPLFVAVDIPDAAHAVTVNVEEWTTLPAFSSAGVPSAAVLPHAPWLNADRAADTVHFSLVSISATGCEVGHSIQLSLLRQNRFEELALQFENVSDAIVVTIRPGAPDAHTLRLPK